MSSRSAKATRDISASVTLTEVRVQYTTKGEPHVLEAKVLAHIGGAWNPAKEMEFVYPLAKTDFAVFAGALRDAALELIEKVNDES